MNRRLFKKGFTLIELLVVIGILAILLTIVLIAINPARQFNLSNDTKRRSEVLSILNAVHQYAADPAHKGILPAGIPTGVVGTDDLELCGPTSATCVDLCTMLVPTYISALPVDPENTGTTDPVTVCTAAYTSGYHIVKDTVGRVTVTAPLTSNATATMISITR
jgi:prepilin-type N-terminal cleavage/methylation domain-containing protein